MAAPQQGIMALPETDQAGAPQLSLNESYDAAKAGLSDADPQLGQAYNDEMAKAMPALLALSDEELDALLQMIQYLHDHPEEYAQRVKELEADGLIDAGDLPPEYDENFLTVFGSIILEAQKNNEPAAPTEATMQPPMAMARGGIAEAARMVANQGRSGDTMLAHITKDEAKMLKKRGGVGTVNPRTGLPEYGLWKSITNVVTAPVKAVVDVGKSVVSGVGSAIKSVGNVVKSVLASPIGKIAATVALATFLGPAGAAMGGGFFGTTAAMGLAGAGVTALSGGNLKDIVRSGVTGAIAGYGASTLGPALGGAAGVSSAAGQAALGAGAAGTGVGLLTGKSIKDSVKEGMMSAAIAGSIAGASNMATGKEFLAPAEAGTVKVDQKTGQVSTSGSTPASSSTAPQQGDWLKQWQAEGANMSVPGQTPPPAQVTAPPVEKTWWDKTTDFFSPSARAEAGSDQAMKSVMDKYGVTQEQVLNAPANSILGKAYSAATPGILSTYGPAIGAGLGITALTGGFKPADQPQMSPEMANVMSGQATRDLMAANPKNYLVQNLPGVQYDDRGNIIGSTPWTPRGPGQVEVASSNYIPFSLPTTYSTPAGSIGSRTVNQPYNTASMYTNLMPPRYAAAGGFMQTPLSMDNGPRMAQMSVPAPMNTPGVPMNLPMQYAIGGIASLAAGGYPRRTGQISGPGTETSDNIPAMLSDGEFVMTAKAVRGAGGGNRMAGAKKMYALMHQLEKNAARG